MKGRGKKTRVLEYQSKCQLARIGSPYFSAGNYRLERAKGKNFRHQGTQPARQGCRRSFVAFVLGNDDLKDTADCSFVSGFVVVNDHVQGRNPVSVSRS
jgi:hypothetical protein